jgi:hypothetical protein
MTANAGKGADGKPEQRSTGADAKGGNSRKKTSSAAKPPSDEVTLRTTSDDTNGSGSDTSVDEDRAEETALSVEDDEETRRDIEPAAEDSSPSSSSSDASDAAEDDDDATVVDTPPESFVTRTEFSTDGFSSDTSSFETTRRDDSPKLPSGSGESMPSPGRGAAMDASTPSSRGYGNPAPPSAPSPPPGAPPRGLTPPRGPAANSASARVARLTGALRKPERSGSRKPPRKAHLQVARFEPWSVMKFSFIMSLVCFLVLFVAVAVLYVILSWLGVFDALTNTIRDLTSNDQGKSGGINPASWFSAARILGYTALIGTLNVLLITALATVWSVIYNMASDLVGGVEVTLKEADQ